MNSTNRRTTHVRIVEALCACALCIILLAGLWPLHVPKNHVQWLEKENGLDFGRYGSIWSSGTFQELDSHGESSSAIEIWLQPGFSSAKHTILAFEGSGHPTSPFSLHQRKDAMRVQRYNVDERGTYRIAWFDVRGVFRQKEPVFVTINLEKHNTTVYVDGVLASTETISGVSTNSFTGRLVVADSPTASDNWTGQIRGLAIYRRSLTPPQVVQHYESWTRGGRPTLTGDEALSALYLFNEHAGRTVHNALDSVTDLLIPEHYYALHKPVLLPPWREYRPTWSYWGDTALNVAGFIPLGFSFAAYFSLVRPIKNHLATTIVLGFATSFTIEILQAFLPMRDSGMTDLITNTLGTAIGVMSYRWSFAQGLLNKASQPSQGDFSVETTRRFELVSTDPTIPCVRRDTNYEVKQQ